MKKELEEAYDDFKVLTPERVKEEIVFDGAFFTVARITIELPPLEGTEETRFIAAEGASKRSGEMLEEDVKVDEPNTSRSHEIALGRARKAMALKLIAKKPWVKIHNNLMG